MAVAMLAVEAADWLYPPGLIVASACDDKVFILRRSCPRWPSVQRAREPGLRNWEETTHRSHQLALDYQRMHVDMPEQRYYATVVARLALVDQWPPRRHPQKADQYRSSRIGIPAFAGYNLPSASVVQTLTARCAGGD
jgi:hypothetical protein